jgi:hypothetical protein
LGQWFADLLHHLFGQFLVPAGRAEHKVVPDEREQEVSRHADVSPGSVTFAVVRQVAHLPHRRSYEEKEFGHVQHQVPAVQLFGVYLGTS